MLRHFAFSVALCFWLLCLVLCRYLMLLGLPTLGNRILLLAPLLAVGFFFAGFLLQLLLLLALASEATARFFPFLVTTFFLAGFLLLSVPPPLLLLGCRCCYRGWYSYCRLPKRQLCMFGLHNCKTPTFCPWYKIFAEHDGKEYHVRSMVWYVA